MFASDLRPNRTLSFFCCVRLRGLLESIPLAGRTGFAILTIDYRQAPEAVFPAVGEVSAAVNTHRLFARAGVDADLNV